MANSVVHFEISYDELDRVKKFYSEVFGWAFQDLGEDMGGYVLVYPNGEINETRATEGINGGMMRRSASGASAGPPNAFVCTISVEDAEATLEKVKSAGGTIEIPADVVPGIGMLAYFRDPENNLVGVLQTLERAM